MILNGQQHRPAVLSPQKAAHDPSIRTMSNLAPAFNQLLVARNASPIPSPQSRPPSPETADEFLKEAYRIVSLRIQAFPKTPELTPVYVYDRIRIFTL